MVLLEAFELPFRPGNFSPQTFKFFVLILSSLSSFFNFVLANPTIPENLKCSSVGDCRDPITLEYLTDLVSKYNIHLKAESGTRAEEKALSPSDRDPYLMREIRAESTSFGGMSAFFFLDWTLRHSLDGRANLIKVLNSTDETKELEQLDLNPLEEGGKSGSETGSLRRPPFPKLMRRKLSHGNPSRTLALIGDTGGPAPGGKQISVYIKHLLEDDPGSKRIFYFGLSGAWGNSYERRRGATIFRTPDQGLIAVHDHLSKYLDPLPKEQWEASILAVQKRKEEAISNREKQAERRKTEAVTKCEKENTESKAKYKEDIQKAKDEGGTDIPLLEKLMSQIQSPVVKDCTMPENVVPENEPDEEKQNFDKEQTKMDEEEKNLKENPPKDSYIGRWELGVKQFGGDDVDGLVVVLLQQWMHYGGTAGQATVWMQGV